MGKIKQRHRNLFASILALSIILSCVLVLQFTYNKCFWWDCAPSRSFTIFDLNLPRDFFPPNAEIHDLHFLKGDNVSLEAAATTNYWKNGVSIYIVRRFSTEERAIRHYVFDSQVKFTRPFNEETQLSNYKVENANDSTIQCGYVINDHRCVYVARYAEFTLFFSGSIGENEMTEDDFIDAVTYIDTKLANLINADGK